ncbi:hypothetical protein AKJ16_DCAP06108 [Drosera capensis]
MDRINTDIQLRTFQPSNSSTSALSCQQQQWTITSLNQRAAGTIETCTGHHLTLSSTTMFAVNCSAAPVRATAATAGTLKDREREGKLREDMGRKSTRVLVLGGTGRVGGSTAIALSRMSPGLSTIVGGRNRLREIRNVSDFHTGAVLRKNLRYWFWETKCAEGKMKHRDRLFKVDSYTRLLQAYIVEFFEIQSKFHRTMLMTD